MGYRTYPPPGPRLIGYDPECTLPRDHLARLVEQVVEATVKPERHSQGPGQPPYDPRLCIKVLVYGYATGVRSSRQLERLCQESLAYLYLTRGDWPSYRTLCTARLELSEEIEAVWVGLFTIAEQLGIERVGRIVVDSTKIRANTSSEAVLKQAEFEALRTELERILAEAVQVDAQEDAEGRSGETCLGKVMGTEQMREIVRRVRKALKRAPEAHRADSPEDQDGAGAPADSAAERVDPTPVGSPAVTARMRCRVAEAVQVIDEAQHSGAKFVCLTDPDAQMMLAGREQRVRECHSLEIAVDNGLLVVAQTSQAKADNARLADVVEAAQRCEPQGVQAVDADSGYYQGDSVGQLIAAGIDTCIPDSNTAGDLHRGRAIGTTRAHSAAARSRSPGPGSRGISLYAPELEAARQRFADPQHQQRYRNRGPAVETPFGFIRSCLGYVRWLLRGKRKVEREAILIKTAFQLRKLHVKWKAVVVAGA